MLVTEAEIARLLSFVRAGSMPLTYVARDGTVLEANDTSVRNLGLPRERVVGHSILEVLPDAGEFRGRFERVFETGESLLVEDVIILPSGPRRFKSTLDPVLDASGTVSAVQVHSWDVTHEQEVAESLARADQKLAALLDQSPYVVIAFARDGAITYVNQVNPGFQREDVLGTNARQFIDPEWHAAYDAGLKRVLDDGLPTKLEFRDIAGSWWESTMVPVRYDGRVEHGLSFSVDITEKRRAAEEQARLQLQMQRSQQLESLGVLAGGIAHDFNNLLQIILANAELALVEGGGASAEPLAEVLQASERAADLCRQMLAYAGRSELAIQAVNLSKLVSEMAHLVEVSLGKGVTLQRSLDHELPAIEGDATQLRQVVLNLITNASDAIGTSQGTITVTTRREQLDRAVLASGYLSDELPAGPYVTLEVRDTGRGIDDAVRPLIFEPFFSTKGTGRGLGLSATLGILRRHRAAIFLESRPGRGTTFRVSFPAAVRAVTLSSAPARSPTTGAHGTVLLIDDDAEIRKVAARALTRAGYEVLLACDGQAGLDVYDERPGRVNVVVLDLTMPVLDGESTLRLLRERAPTLPVILMSGYSDSKFQRDDVRFLGKPFRVSKLVLAVEDALGRSDGTDTADR